MNHNTFQHKLEALSSFPEVKSKTVRAFGNVLESLGNWDLFRINPLRFAEEHRFDPSEMSMCSFMEQRLDCLILRGTCSALRADQLWTATSR